MNFKVLNTAPECTIALLFERGDEVVSSLQGFAADHHLHSSRLSGIGALERVSLGYFDWDRKNYQRLDFQEQLEVLSLLGDIALDGATPKLHAHVVLGRRDGSTLGGHLLEAIVRPTLEVLLIESPAYLRRIHDPTSGLALIDPNA